MKRTLLLLASVFACMCLVRPVSAQDEEGTPRGGLEGATTDSAKDARTASTELPMSGKPYSARLQIDTGMPVVYGDDVVVSVWISPIQGMDVKEVRIHPKGVLASLYRDYEAGANSPPEGAGTLCRTSVVNARVGVPFVATCRLTSSAEGLGRVFNWAAVPLGGGRQQFEVEVVLYEGAEDVSNFYEFGSVDFSSPLLSVIIGGILGAGLWALFLPISTPFPNITAESAGDWASLRARVGQALPQLSLRWLSFAVTLLRSTVLGGATALVLIILARTTEGLDTPIALQIKDLWGGLLVGIFSTPLSKWVRHKVETMMQGS